MDSSKTPEPAEEQDDVNALEYNAEPSDNDATGGSETSGVIDASSQGGSTPKPAAPAPKSGGIKQLARRFNLYLLLFVFILVIGASVLTIAYFQSKKLSSTSTIDSQELTQDALRQIASSDATLGNTGQVLNIQSSAVFAGKVLIRDGLEVAANLQVGGTTALTNLTVSGSSQFGQVQINKNLSVAGDAAVQGSLTAKSLQISGSVNLSGPLSAPQITTTNLQLNSDLVLTHHIVAGGPTPSLAQGPGLGGGGTASISGSDTAGTIGINVGSSAPAGCFATVTFRTKYNATPVVMLTPVGSNGGIVNYYVERSASNFSVCAATASATGSFAFDYFIVE
jgi:hypothetical protein